jgi:hypothetical protein
MNEDLKPYLFVLLAILLSALVVYLHQATVTARCGNGRFSRSKHRRGTCSGNDGVAEWLPAAAFIS